MPSRAVFSAPGCVDDPSARDQASDLVKPLSAVGASFVTKEEDAAHADTEVVPLTVGLRGKEFAGMERAFILVLPAAIDDAAADRSPDSRRAWTCPLRLPAEGVPGFAGVSLPDTLWMIRRGDSRFGATPKSPLGEIP